MKDAEFYEQLRKRNEKRWGTDRFQTAHHLGHQTHAGFPDMLAELLQNAEDAEAARFGLQILPEGFLVWNDGRPFNEEDVKAISGLLISAKTQDAIGYFGIGFKAVLLVSSAPCVLSGQHRFWLQEGLDPYPLDDAVPSTGGLRPPPVPKVVWQTAKEHTVFWLPWRDEERSEAFRRWLSEKGLSLASFLLFLDKLERIELDRVGAWEVVRQRRSERAVALTLSGPKGRAKYLRFSWTARPPREVVEKVVNSLYENDPRRERWLNTPPHGLFGLAIRLNDEGRPEPEAGKVFVYLPTDEETGFHFHLQGRMALTGDRKRLRWDDPMTRWALEELRDKARQWPAWLEEENLFPAAWHVLPRPRDARDPWQEVAEALREALKEDPFFYGDDGQPYPRDQVFLAHREDLYDLLSPEDLAELTGREGARWVHPEMRRGHARDTVYSLGVEEVSADAFISWLVQHTDPTWWEGKSLSWLERLYSYLDAIKAPTDKIKQIPIVRVQNGSHVLPNRAVFPPEADDEVPSALRDYLEGMPIVHRNLADKFRGLLNRLGTRDFHIGSLLDRFLQSHYGGDRCPTPRENVRHIRLLFKLCESGRLEKWKLKNWQDLPILRDTQGNWVPPSQAYLPPELGGIEEVQVYLAMAGGRPIVAPDYRQAEDDKKAWADFLEALGCARLPRMWIEEERLRGYWSRKEWCEEHEIPSRSLNFYEGWDEWRWKGIDWRIDGMDEVLARLESHPPSKEESRALWVVASYISREGSQSRWVTWPEKGKDAWYSLRPTESRVVWFYRTDRSSQGVALWVKRLRELAWLPDEKGQLHRPKELFDPKLKSVLGEEGFPYLHPDIPLAGHREWAKTVGVHLDVSEEKVCAVLEERLKEKREPTAIAPIYEWLAQRVKSTPLRGDRLDLESRLREIFSERPLIYIPNRGQFKATQVCWYDPSDVMPSLRDTWRDLYEFFVRILEVPENPDVNDIARFLVEALGARKDAEQWHKAAFTVQQRWDELDKSWQDALRACEWPGVINGERVWRPPDRLFLPDDPPLARLFEGRVARWALKDLEDLAQKVGVRPVSQATPEVACDGDRGRREDLRRALVRLWNALRWFASARGETVPKVPPDVREAAEIYITYRLGGIPSSPEQIEAALEHNGQYVLWVLSDIKPRNLCHGIGTALEERFQVKHLREFLKEIWDIQEEGEWRDVMERWAKHLGETEGPAFPDAVVTEAEELPPATEEGAAAQPDLAPREDETPPADFTSESTARARVESSERSGPTPETREARPKWEFHAQVPAASAGTTRARSEGYRRGDTAKQREVEEIAMEMARMWLEEEGFEVVDVSGKRLGYDLEARRDGQVRYVEVKGLSQRGPVQMTENEWQTAQQLGDAYCLFVYVVEEERGWALLNPAGALDAERRYRVEVVYMLHDVWEIADQVW